MLETGSGRKHTRALAAGGGIGRLRSRPWSTRPVVSAPDAEHADTGAGAGGILHSGHARTGHRACISSRATASDNTTTCGSSAHRHRTFRTSGPARDACYDARVLTAATEYGAPARYRRDGRSGRNRTGVAGRHRPNPTTTRKTAGASRALYARGNSATRPDLASRRRGLHRQPDRRQLRSVP